MRRIPFLVAVLVLSACMNSSPEAQIKDLITEANYCDTAADCVDAGGKCPFDCYVFVNKNEVEHVKTAVQGFASQCTYSCLAIQGVDCVSNKCQPIFDAPPLDDTATDGNVGAACNADADCQTPMSFLTRSSCPFGSQCINSKCAVVCPMMNQDLNPQVRDSHAVTCAKDADCDCRNYIAEGTGDCRCVQEACVAVVAQ